jgi:hypothetical protein
MATPTRPTSPGPADGRVVAHLCGQIERNAQPWSRLGEQVPITLVRFRSRSKARVLAHRPEPAAVHRGLNPLVKGNSPGRPVAAGIPAGKIGRNAIRINHIRRSSVILTFLTVTNHEPTMKLVRHSPVSDRLAEKMTNAVDRFPVEPMV